MSESSYSPRLRTGVVLCGTGTAGAYQAGVLRALAEAGVKIDVIAAHGAGVDDGALRRDRRRRHGSGTRRAVDRASGFASAYRWRAALRVGGLRPARGGRACSCRRSWSWSRGASRTPRALLAALVNLPRRSASADRRRIARRSRCCSTRRSCRPSCRARSCSPARRASASSWSAAVRAARQERSAGGGSAARSGGGWSGSPLERAASRRGTLIDALWQLVRGASNEPRPTAAEIGRRYVDVLDRQLRPAGLPRGARRRARLDARRDLVGAVLPPQAARRLRGRGDRRGSARGRDRRLHRAAARSRRRFPASARCACRSRPRRSRCSFRPTATGAASGIASAIGPSWPCA